MMLSIDWDVGLSILAETLLHFVWQGALIALACWVGLELFRTASPHWRYTLCLAALALMTVVPPITFCYLARNVEGESKINERRASADQWPAPSRNVEARAPPEGILWELAAAIPEDGIDSPAVRVESDEVPIGPAVEVSGAMPHLHPQHEPVEAYVDPVPDARPSGTTLSDERMARIAPVETEGAAEVSAQSDSVGPSGWQRLNDPRLAQLWLLGVAVFSLRLVIGVIGMHRLGRDRQPVPSDWESSIRRLRERFGLMRWPEIKLSPRVREPLSAGFFKPLILLPASWVTQLSPTMLEAILAHELAHIRRWDVWVNGWQRVMETFLFYHPAVWWLSDRLRTEREYCCDERAVWAVGQRLTYASALEFVARQRLGVAGPLLTTGMGGRRMAILKRVRRVLGVPEQRGPWNECVLALAVSGVPILLMVVLAGLSPVRAEKDTEEPENPAAAEVEQEVVNGEDGAEKEVAVVDRDSQETHEHPRDADLDFAEHVERADRERHEAQLRTLEILRKEREEIQRFARELEGRILDLEGQLGIDRQDHDKFPNADEARRQLLRRQYGPNHPRVQWVEQLIEYAQRRTKEREQRQEHQRDDADRLREEEVTQQIKLFRLHHIDAEQAATIITQLIPQASTRAPRADLLVVSAPPETLKVIEATLFQLDEASRPDVAGRIEVGVLYLKKAPASEAALTLHELMSHEHGLLAIVPDNRLNALIVQGRPEVVERAGQLIEAIDVQSPDDLPPEIGEQREEPTRDRQVQVAIEELREAVRRLMGEIRGLREEVRELQEAGTADRPESQRTIVAYDIRVADPDLVLTVMQTLLAGSPGVRLSLDEMARKLVAFAHPEEHQMIESTLQQLDVREVPERPE